MHNKPIVNKIARYLTILMLMAAPVIGATSTKTLITTNDISSLRAGFRDFRFKVHGFETTKFEHYFTNGAAGVTASDYSFLFRVLGTFGGSNTYFIALENSDITKSGDSVNFTIQTTNIPPNGKYKAELLGYTGNITNFSRSFGRGTWTVTDSIYDEDSIGTFPFPSFSVTDLTYTLTASNGWGVSVSEDSKIYRQYPTNLSAFTVISDTDFKGFNVTNVNRLTVNNLTITNPSSMKLGNVVFSESAGKLRGNSSNIAYEAYVIAATNGLGDSVVSLAGETNKVVYRDGRYAMTSNLNMGGNSITNLSTNTVFFNSGDSLGVLNGRLRINGTNILLTIDTNLFVKINVTNVLSSRVESLVTATNGFASSISTLNTETGLLRGISVAISNFVHNATNAVLIKSTNLAITAANAYTVTSTNTARIKANAYTDAATNAAATPHIFFDVRQTNMITSYHETLLLFPWNLVTHNIGSAYNADSNGAVIVEAGWYEFNASVTRIGLLLDGDFAHMTIFTNGLPWKAGLESTYGGDHNVDAIGYFGVDDLVTVYVWYYYPAAAYRYWGNPVYFYDQQTIGLVGSFFQGRMVRK